MAIKILNKDGFIMNNVLGRKVGIVIECASDSIKVPDELGGFIWIDDKSNIAKIDRSTYDKIFNSMKILNKGVI